MPMIGEDHHDGRHGNHRPQQPGSHRIATAGRGAARHRHGGEKALERLTRSPDPVIARSARNVSAVENRWDDTDIGSPNRTPEYEVAPAGSALPAGFAVAVPPTDERARCDRPGACVASVMDMDGDGVPEVLVATNWAIQLWNRDANGAWSRTGRWTPVRCPGPDATPPDMREVLRKGDVRPVDPVWPELEIGGVRSGPINLERDCRREVAAAATAAR